MASQQGAYLGRLLSKGYRLGSYRSRVPPYKLVNAPSQSGNSDSSRDSRSGPRLDDSLVSGADGIVSNSATTRSDMSDHLDNRQDVDTASLAITKSVVSAVEAKRKVVEEKEDVYISETLGVGGLGVTDSLPVDTASVLREYALSIAASTTSGDSDPGDRAAINNTVVADSVAIDSVLASLQRLNVTVAIARPFQFLNLGVLAYVGASQAIAQVCFCRRC